MVLYGQVIRSHTHTKKKRTWKSWEYDTGRVLSVGEKSYSIFSSLVWSNIRFLPCCWCLFPFSFGGDAEECFFFGSRLQVNIALRGGVLLLSPIFLLLLFFSTRFKQSDTHHLFWQLPKKVVNFFQWIPNDDAVLTAIFVWTIPRLDVCLLVTREEEKYVVWRHHQNGFGNSLLLF